MAADSFEGVVRLGVFLVALAALVGWERWASLRRLNVRRDVRWRTNFGLGVIDAVLVRVVFPAGAVGVALLAQEQGWGVFNVWPAPHALAVAAAVLLLDLAVYFQHWLFHAVPWLWRMHRVHHADPELDVSTALRFHPAESLLSMVLKSAVVLLFGLPPLGVLLFEIVLNAAAMFNHTNAALPARLEPWVRRLLVTPDMHRIHHSTRGEESRSNFGFSLSWWDRLFGTYRRASKLPQATMPFGLPDEADAPDYVHLGYLLRMPFISHQRPEAQRR